MLARIDDVIFKERGFRLRDTQKLSVMTLLLNNRHTLGQVATGEGKTLIIVAVAIIKVKRGEKVDIITSSSVLARRDAEENESIYNHFGIQVAHNCDEDIAKRTNAYSECHVVYGDLSSFQRDYLLHSFYQKNVLGDRKPDNIIVDEVDCLLLDRGNNILYLSHDLPDIDKLEPVYVFIWHWINTSNILSNEAIKSAVLWHLYGVIKMEDIRKLDEGLNESQLSRIWNGLIKANIIDQSGKLLVGSVDGGKLSTLLGHDLSTYRDRLEYLLNSCINREKCFQIPNYLRPFVELHLDSWIESAKIAYCMEANQDYVVDLDRSQNGSEHSPNITILDRDTGTDMKNSQWEAALHQFIQLKHGCKISLQSLKAVFISNVTFFKLYQHLYGLTGTLGSHRERDLLGEIYQVDFVYVPTARTKRFYEYLPIISPNSNAWMKEIVKKAQEMTKVKKRSILIICETVNQVFKLQATFKEISTPNVRTYTRDYEKFDIKKLPPGHIIIATNLAGRGTDIKISNELKAEGGLHVCLSYLPRNIRIEQQAFGRTARAGDRGTGQLIIQNSGEVAVESSSRLLFLKQERDSRELHRLPEIKKYYETHIKTEERWFREFGKQYNNLLKMLQTGQVTKYDELLRQTLLRGILDSWAYWLDVNSSDITASTTNNPITSFINQLKGLKLDKFDDLYEWVDKSLSQMVKLGLCLLRMREDKSAVVLFDRVIQREPHFSEAAHYYKVVALSHQDLSDVETVGKLKQELCTAVVLFDDRKTALMARAALIDSIKAKNRSNIIQINGFVEQKKSVCGFYSRLIKSVNNILGHPVTPNALEESNNLKTSYDIFDALLRDGILLKPTMMDTMPENVFVQNINRISYEFGATVAELQQFLQKYRNNKGEPIELADFVRSMEQSINIPSRDLFWNYLVEQNAITKEKKFIICEISKLQEYPEVFEMIIKRELYKTKLTFDQNDIFLQPTLKPTEKTFVFDKNELKNTIGELNFNTLQQRGILLNQRTGKLNYDAKIVSFKMFDSISAQDFDRLKISRKDAETILSLLVNSGIIKKSADPDAHSLAVQFNRISGIKLGSYKMYENDVKNLVNYCFSFRIAYQALLKEKSQDYEIPLMSNPHRALVAELFTSQIIKPVMVGEKNLSLVPSALSKLNLDQKIVNNVQQFLINLKSSLSSLKVEQTFGHGRESIIDDWYLFSLNGLDSLLVQDNKLNSSENLNEIDVTKSVSIGNAEKSIIYLLEYKTKSKFFKTVSSMQFEDAFKILFNSLTTPSQLILLNYNTLVNFSSIMSLTSINATFMMSAAGKLNIYGIKVIGVLPSRAITQETRRFTKSILHSLNVELENSNLTTFISNRLNTLSTYISTEVMSIIDSQMRSVAITLKQLDCSNSDQLNSAADAVLDRHRYYDDFKLIFDQMAQQVLDSLSIQVMYSSKNKSNLKVNFDPIASVNQQVYLEYNPKLAEIVSVILNDLNESILVAGKKSVRSASSNSCNELFEEWKKRLQTKISDLLYKFVIDPIVEKGTNLLVQKLKLKEQVKLSAHVPADSVTRYFKHLRTERLQKETDSDGLESTAVGNILDMQFNEVKQRKILSLGDHQIKSNCGY